MPYAAAADIVELYGSDALYVADRDGDGVPDVGAAERALASATAEIDTYLAARYALPLIEPRDPMLRQWCVDIALYRLALNASVLSDEHRRRYEDAIDALRRLAKGETRLTLAPDPDADPDAEDPGPNAVVQGGPPRLFTRDTLRDI
jgi:phage gp36-like protein